jgi:hypothetical protein
MLVLASIATLFPWPVLGGLGKTAEVPLTFPSAAAKAFVKHHFMEGCGKKAA